MVKSCHKVAKRNCYVHSSVFTVFPTACPIKMPFMCVRESGG